MAQFLCNIPYFTQFHTTPGMNQAYWRGKTKSAECKFIPMTCEQTCCEGKLFVKKYVNWITTSTLPSKYNKDTFPKRLPWVNNSYQLNKWGIRGLVTSVKQKHVFVQFKICTSLQSHVTLESPGSRSCYFKTIKMSIKPVKPHWLENNGPVIEICKSMEPFNISVSMRNGIQDHETGTIQWLCWHWNTNIWNDDSDQGRTG